MTPAERDADPQRLRSWLLSTLLLAALVAVATGVHLWSLHETLAALPLSGAHRDRLLSAELWPAYGWLAASPLIALLGQRFAFGSLRWPRLLLVHLLAGGGIAAGVHACERRVETVVVVGAGRDAGTAALPDAIRRLVDEMSAELGAQVAAGIDDRPLAWFDWLTNLVVYLALAAVVAGLTYRRRADALERAAAWTERELARSELRTLRAQLQPHFLFNALNSVQVLIGEDVERGRSMLQQLAALLRASLADVDKPQVPLSRELEVLRSYAALERMRFQDRIRITIESEPGLDGVLVPPFCVQPLVENALRHGPGARARGGSIAVTARREGLDLVLAVADDGPGIVAVPAPPAGFGVHGLRERLRRLHGTAARLELVSPPGGGLIAEIRVPLAPAAAPAVPA